MKTDTDTAIKLPAIMSGKSLKPADVQAEMKKSFTEIYDKIEAEIKGAVIVLDTAKGRKEVASRAYRISQTKVGLEDAANKLTADQKAIVNIVVKERLAMSDELDRLRDLTRAPLNKWEADEEKRIADLKISLEYLRDLGRVDAMIDPLMIRETISDTTSMFDSTVWGDYQPMADAAHEAAITKFKADLAASEKRIADEAELAVLRAKQVEQDRKDEAARVEKEAEELAGRQEQERKEAAEKAEADEKERQRIADERAVQDAADRVQAEQDRADRAEADAKQAETDRVAADLLAESQRKKADRQAAIDATLAAEHAVQEERNRMARIKATEDDAAEKRAADLKHRKTINNAALVALIKCSDISEDQGKMIIQAVAKGQIPHIAISY